MINIASIFMQKYIGSSDFPEAWKNNTANIYMSCGEEESLKSVAFFSGLNISISIRKEVSSSAKVFFPNNTTFQKARILPRKLPRNFKKENKMTCKTGWYKMKGQDSCSKLKTKETKSRSIRI